MFGSDYKRLGSAMPPRGFGWLFIILGSFSLLIQYRPGHPPDRWDLGLALLWIGLGVLHLVNDRKYRLSLVADASGFWVTEAKGLLATGDKMAAIKVVRDATHVGLAQAKQIVESWELK